MILDVGEDRDKEIKEIIYAFWSRLAETSREKFR